MSERYTKLFALEKNLYIEGSPLLICAGSLLYDSYTKNNLAQIKYKNLSDKTVSAVKISITMYDAAGDELKSRLEYQYTGLSAERDGEFGQKAAVILPPDSVCSFSVCITEVLFADGEKCCADPGPRAPLKPFRPLAEALGDEELASQYRIRYGTNCLYEPAEDLDLWLCTCGALNHAYEHSCHSCHKVLSALKQVNLSSLRSECTERLKNEELQQGVDEAEAKLKKKKYIKTAAVIIPLLFIAVMIAAFIPGAVRRSDDYAEAEAFLAAGNYDRAAEAFGLLGSYKDSALMAEKEVPYARAQAIMKYAEAADEKGLKLISVARSSLKEDDNVSIILYEAAAKEFEALDGYKDSAELRNTCLAAVKSSQDADIQAQYDAAADLLAEKKFCLARDAFNILGDFSDSREMAQEAIYMKAVSLFNFMESHNFRDLYAALSAETDIPSRVYIAQDDALSQGEDYITELNAAFGRDSVDIDIKEMDDDLIPFHESLTQLFTLLGDYKDSDEYIEKIEALNDFTREFFKYISDGDLPAASSWLEECGEEFEDRELWTERINQYIDLCGTWELNSGDSTLIAASAGESLECSTVYASLVISEDEVILRLVPAEADHISVELSAEPGSGRFCMNDDAGNTYCVALNIHNLLAYSKYSGSANPASSCDYSKAE